MIVPYKKVPVEKGVEYDCPMFEVRCKQPCVEKGLRQTDKCPYDNYRGSGKTSYSNPAIEGFDEHGNPIGDPQSILFHDRQHTLNTSVYPETAKKSIKGANAMAKNNTKPTAPATGGSGNGSFQPTFRKYSDMTKGEQEAFRQGAKTSENKVKERLGFVKPKN